MKILIDLPDDVSLELFELAGEKGWNRKQYINWHLTLHTNAAKKKRIERLAKKSKSLS